ncbi:MAG: hypothetical protein QNJ31_04110 [Candidatus Caenarcaniphilales bacterium]|nr:hypothetical protein [Candidatus Caenarcaniphilales bacterium]
MSENLAVSCYFNDPDNYACAFSLLLHAVYFQERIQNETISRHSIYETGQKYNWFESTNLENGLFAEKLETKYQLFQKYIKEIEKYNNCKRIVNRLNNELEAKGYISFSLFQDLKKNLQTYKEQKNISELLKSIFEILGEKQIFLVMPPKESIPEGYQLIPEIISNQLEPIGIKILTITRNSHNRDEGYLQDTSFKHIYNLTSCFVDQPEKGCNPNFWLSEVFPNSTIQNLILDHHEMHSSINVDRLTQASEVNLKKKRISEQMRQIHEYVQQTRNQTHLSLQRILIGLNPESAEPIENKALKNKICHGLNFHITVNSNYGACIQSILELMGLLGINEQIGKSPLKEKIIQYCRESIATDTAYKLRNTQISHPNQIPNSLIETINQIILQIQINKSCIYALIFPKAAEQILKNNIHNAQLFIAHELQSLVEGIFNYNDYLVNNHFLKSLKKSNDSSILQVLNKRYSFSDFNDQKQDLNNVIQVLLAKGSTKIDHQLIDRDDNKLLLSMNIIILHPESLIYKIFQEVQSQNPLGTKIILGNYMDDILRQFSFSSNYISQKTEQNPQFLILCIVPDEQTTNSILVLGRSNGEKVNNLLEKLLTQLDTEKRPDLTVIGNRWLGRLIPNTNIPTISNNIPRSKLTQISSISPYGLTFPATNHKKDYIQTQELELPEENNSPDIVKVLESFFNDHFFF